jgi:hypothetical protein
MGLGSEIYPKYGIEVLPQRAFRFEPEHDMMYKSIEMGRAYH